MPHEDEDYRGYRRVRLAAGGTMLVAAAGGQQISRRLYSESAVETPAGALRRPQGQDDMQALVDGVMPYIYFKNADIIETSPGFSTSDNPADPPLMNFLSDVNITIRDKIDNEFHVPEWVTIPDFSKYIDVYCVSFASVYNPDANAVQNRLTFEAAELDFFSNIARTRFGLYETHGAESLRQSLQSLKRHIYEVYPLFRNYASIEIQKVGLDELRRNYALNKNNLPAVSLNVGKRQSINYNYKFRFNAHLDRSDLPLIGTKFKNLVYYFFVDVDWIPMLAAIGIDVDTFLATPPPFIDYFSPPAKRHIAIKDGAIPRYVHLFKTSNGDVWQGPVHYANFTTKPAGWYGGAAPALGLPPEETARIAASQPILRRVAIENKKINYLGNYNPSLFNGSSPFPRDMIVSERPQIPEEVFSHAIASMDVARMSLGATMNLDMRVRRMVFKRYVADNINRNKGVFTNFDQLPMIDGPSSNTSINFNIQIEDILRSQSRYSRLIDILQDGDSELGNENYLVDIMSAVSNVSIKIYRRRLHTGSTIPNRPGFTRDMAFKREVVNSEPAVLVFERFGPIESMDGVTMTFGDPLNNEGNPVFSGSGLLSILASDRAGGHKYGYYRYYVELEMRDPIYVWLKNVIEIALKPELQALKENEFYFTHLAPSVTSYRRGPSRTLRRMVVDPETGKYNNTWLRENTESIAEVNRLIQAVVYRYHETIPLFMGTEEWNRWSGKFHTGPQQGLYQGRNALHRPADGVEHDLSEVLYRLAQVRPHGSPQYLEQTIDLYENFISLAEKILDTKLTNVESSTSDGYSNGYRKNRDKNIIRFTKALGQDYNASAQPLPDDFINQAVASTSTARTARAQRDRDRYSNARRGSGKIEVSGLRFWRYEAPRPQEPLVRISAASFRNLGTYRAVVPTPRRPDLGSATARSSYGHLLGATAGQVGGPGFRNVPASHSSVPAKSRTDMRSAATSQMIGTSANLSADLALKTGNAGIAVMASADKGPTTSFQLLGGVRDGMPSASRSSAAGNAGVSPSPLSSRDVPAGNGSIGVLYATHGGDSGPDTATKDRTTLDLDDSEVALREEGSSGDMVLPARPRNLQAEGRPAGTSAEIGELMF